MPTKSTSGKGMLLIFRYSLLKTAHMLIMVIKFLLQMQRLFKYLPTKKKKSNPKHGNKPKSRMKLLYLQMKSHLGHLLKLPVTEARCLCFSISYLLRNMGLTYCCRWTLQGCTVELGERWHTIRHRLGSWWLCWLLSLCFTCGWRAKEISERGRTKG